MENEKPMRKMEKEQPGDWKKTRRVWCHRNQGRKEFRREGKPVVGILEAGKEGMVENSSVLRPGCGWWWISGRR